MGVFRGIRPVHVRSYIKEFEHEDASVVANDRYTVKLQNVSIDESGNILYNSKPIEVFKDIMIVFPEVMTDVGYPYDMTIGAGRTVKVKPSLWALLGDEERTDLISSLNEASPVLEFKAYRSLTKG
jgi:hypothetical protein